MCCQQHNECHASIIEHTIALSVWSEGLRAHRVLSSYWTISSALTKKKLCNSLSLYSIDCFFKQTKIEICLSSTKNAWCPRFTSRCEVFSSIYLWSGSWEDSTATYSMETVLSLPLIACTCSKGSFLVSAMSCNIRNVWCAVHFVAYCGRYLGMWFSLRGRRPCTLIDIWWSLQTLRCSFMHWLETGFGSFCLADGVSSGLINQQIAELFYPSLLNIPVARQKYALTDVSTGILHKGFRPFQ